jgi:hypothetical protein
MKKLVVSALALVSMSAAACGAKAPSQSTAQAAASTASDADDGTVIVVASLGATGANAGKAVIETGFYDSAFDYNSQDEVNQDMVNREFCFVGTAKGACAAMKKAVDAIDKQYSEGAHDDIQGFTCDDSQSIHALATYTLVSDYDNGAGLKVTRRVGECEKGPTAILEASKFTGNRVTLDADESLWAYPEASQSFCYVGNASEVCAKVTEMVATIQANYDDDGGNFIENMKCTLDGEVAKLDFHIIEGRSQDQGGSQGQDVPTKRDLARCASGDAH